MLLAAVESLPVAPVPLDPVDPWLCAAPLPAELVLSVAGLVVPTVYGLVVLAPCPAVSTVKPCVCAGISFIVSVKSPVVCVWLGPVCVCVCVCAIVLLPPMAPTVVDPIKNLESVMFGRYLPAPLNIGLEESLSAAPSQT